MFDAALAVSAYKLFFYDAEDCCKVHLKLPATHSITERITAIRTPYVKVASMPATPVKSRLESGIAKSIACLDPRLDVSRIANTLNISPSTIWKTFQRLRQSIRKAWHIRDLRPLGLGAAIVYSGKQLSNPIEKLDTPIVRYLYSHSITIDGTHIYGFLIPFNLTTELLAALENLGKTDYGYTIPRIPQLYQHRSTRWREVFTPPSRSKCGWCTQTPRNAYLCTPRYVTPCPST